MLREQTKADIQRCVQEEGLIETLHRVVTSLDVDITTHYGLSMGYLRYIVGRAIEGGADLHAMEEILGESFKELIEDLEENYGK